MKNLKSLRVLVVDDEAPIRELLETRLKRKGFDVQVAADGESAIRMARDFRPSACICDLRMPGMNGFEVLKALQIPTLLITGHGDKESAIQAVEEGAFAFFEKPFDLDALEVSLRRALERHEMQKERARLIIELERLTVLQNRELEALEKTVIQSAGSKLLGVSEGIEKVRKTLVQLSRKSTATCLILGNTGTGKDVVARELHALTHPKDHVPFLALNCAAIPSELLESELFGHEKGSFSGAHAARIGLCEATREGTLFLDEVGEMDLRLQAKLLRLLENRTYRRVGANRDLEFKGRIVAATHRNLAAAVKEKKFREDLWYRLQVVTLELPDLKDRGIEDIKLIANQLCAQFGLKGLEESLWSEVAAYDWPGNIRELRNWIERSSILNEHRNGWIHSLPLSHASGNAAAADLQVEGSLSERREAILDHFDREWIRATLQKTQGNISQAAELLGIDRKNLSRRIKELGLESKKRAA